MRDAELRALKVSGCKKNVIMRLNGSGERHVVVVVVAVCRLFDLAACSEWATTTLAHSVINAVARN